MEDPLWRIISAVASKEGVAPEELSPPLQEAIDTDALVHVLESESVSVWFKYNGYVVTIDATGDMKVD